MRILFVNKKNSPGKVVFCKAFYNIFFLTKFIFLFSEYYPTIIPFFIEGEIHPDIKWVLTEAEKIEKRVSESLSQKD